MVQEKHCKVIMLPQNKNSYHKKGDILMCLLDDAGMSYAKGKKDKLVRAHSDRRNDSSLVLGQNLYFISNDEIKLGDWYYVTYLNKIFKADELVNQLGVGETHFKVIASTDKTLKLPAIAESFLKQYVAANGAITDVILEMIRGCDDKLCVIPNRCRQQGKPTICQQNDEWKLNLADNNEVVIVQERGIVINNTEKQKPFDSSQEAESDRFYSGRVSKELEDAAKKYALSIDRGHIFTSINEDVIDDFKEGAQWQKEQSHSKQDMKDIATEAFLAGSMGRNFVVDIKGSKAIWRAEGEIKKQSANDAIAFGDFLKDECSKICPDSNCEGPDPTYWQWKKVNDRYTTLEIYELWQKNR